MSFDGNSSGRAAAMFAVAAIVLSSRGGASAATARTLLVPSEYPTIQAAVDAAANGDSIRVAAGVYLESVVVAGRHELTLAGDPGACIDGGPDAPAIEVTHGGTITVTGFELTSGTDALFLDRTQYPVVHLVHVTSAGGDGIRADAILSDVSVTSSRVDTAAGDGIHVESVSPDRPELTISANTVGPTGGDGIFAYSAEDHGDVVVTNNEVSDSGGFGIRTDCGYAHVASNVVSDSGLDAISVHRTRAECTVIGNTITNAGDDGISVDDTPSVVVEQNEIRGTVGDGVEVVGPAALVRENTIVDAGDAGVRATEADSRFQPAGSYASESISVNTIESPGGAGIVVEGGIGNEVAENLVVSAGGTAIEVSGDQITVTRNTIEQPAIDGVSVENLGRREGVVVTGNTVLGAGVDGVDIGDSNGVFVLGNRVDGAGGCGFRIGDDASHNVFRRNVASECETFGLMVEDGAGRNRIAKSNRFGRVHRRARPRG